MRQLLLFGLSFLLTLLICEIFISKSKVASISNMEFYDDIGRGFRKNLDYVYFNEGFGVGKFNKYGYLGEAISPEKEDHTIRVALLGDSFVESFQVFERDYFGNIARNLLSEEFRNFKFEFLNFGRSGFDFSDMYVYQKTFVEKFNPDYILYIVSQDDMEPKYGDPLMPKTILKNDSLLIDFNFAPSTLASYQNTKMFTQNSTIAQMLNLGLKKVNSGSFWSIILGNNYTNTGNKKESKTNSNTAAYKINSITEKIVSSLDNKKVIFVYRDMEKMPHSLENLCFEGGFKTIDLSKVFNRMNDDGVNPFEWKVTKKHGHWNHKAHKAIAEELANELIDIIGSPN